MYSDLLKELGVRIPFSEKKLPNKGPMIEFERVRASQTSYCRTSGWITTHLLSVRLSHVPVDDSSPPPLLLVNPFVPDWDQSRVRNEQHRYCSDTTLTRD